MSDYCADPTCFLMAAMMVAIISGLAPLDPRHPRPACDPHGVSPNLIFINRSIEML